jgi:hypothetical protein
MRTGGGRLALWFKLSPNMAELTQQAAAEKYHKDVEKKARAKAKNQALALRGAETASAVVAGAGLGALEAYQPTWFKYQIPRIAAAVGGLGAYFFLKENSIMSEIAAGVCLGGLIPLASMGGAMAVEKLQAA